MAASASSLEQPSPTEMAAYTRSGNATQDALETHLAELDKAYKAFCFTSGMAALTTATHLVQPGKKIVAGNNMDGGSECLLREVTEKSGTVVNFVDTTNLEEVAANVCSDTKLVWLESPSNPLQQISDIKKIAEIAHKYDALVLVDNSMMSPVLSQPLDHGADIVMNSATKFMSGHSDALAGVLAVKEESLAREVKLLQEAEGAGLSPFDSWLCLRGIKTMALRVEKQQENAQKIAEFLVEHERVTKVYYAGLPDHPGHDLHKTQAKGAGSVLSFSTELYPLSNHVVETTQYFKTGDNFGSVDSHICLPWFTSHASIPSYDKITRGISGDIIRLCVGIENANDLINDLNRALETGPYTELFNPREK